MVRREGAQEQLVDIPRTPPTASVNRVTIVDLPGVPVDDGIRGLQAYHLLSVPALIQYALAQADALQLPATYRTSDPDSPRMRGDVPRWVDGCLGSPDPEVRAAAHAIGRRLGRNLGYLLATLHRGDTVNRAARAEWSDTEWAHWRKIRQIWLGGGVLSGALGRDMLRHARIVLVETQCISDLSVDITPFPRHMATLGAGRYLPMPEPACLSQRALALDIGHTSIKRAVLGYQGDALTHVTWLQSQPVIWLWRNSPDAGRDIDGREVLAFVVDAICASLREAERRDLDVEPELAMSIATYVDGGRLLGNGVYARMSLLTDDVRPMIADRVAATCGWRPRVTLIHDGTSAAAVHAGEAEGGAPSAVIVVGTALGVGFPAPTAEGLRGIARELAVDEE